MRRITVIWRDPSCPGVQTAPVVRYGGCASAPIEDSGDRLTAWHGEVGSGLRRGWREGGCCSGWETTLRPTAS
jgi:hypothetical protein